MRSTALLLLALATAAAARPAGLPAGKRFGLTHVDRAVAVTPRLMEAAIELRTSPVDNVATTRAPVHLSPAAANTSATSVAAPDDSPPVRFSGFFALNRTYASNMFFVFAGSRSPTAATDPLVLWMTGGPGCSSELALFVENGPWTLQKDGTLLDNPHGWDTAHNMIYIDQPVGTGFSYTSDPRDDVTSEKVVAADVLDFLLEFYDAHPEYADLPFYVTGESYAGHYVPAVASRIDEHNRNPDRVTASISLAGFAIGNGLTDPAVQYGAYADFAAFKGLIGPKTRSAIRSIFPWCKFGIDLCNGPLGFGIVCELALSFCQATVVGPIMAEGNNFNVYDVRKKCVGPLCYDFTYLDDYMARPDVRDGLGVPRDAPWSECDPDVNARLLVDFMRSYADRVTPLVDGDAGVRGLIYVGQEDFICNWYGNLRWVLALPWSGRYDFEDSAFEDVLVGGRPLASVKGDGLRLSYVNIPDAGHMVPMDAPEASLAVITAFTRGEKIASPAEGGGLLRGRGLGPRLAGQHEAGGGGKGGVSVA